MVLTLAEFVVLVLLVYLVEGLVFEAAEDEAEEDRHVGVVVQRHLGALFDEKEHQTVVFTVHVDCHPVQVALEVVGALAQALDAHVVRLDSVHLVHQPLAVGVHHGSVEEGAMAGAMLGCEAQLFNLVDQLLHLK